MKKLLAMLLVFCLLILLAGGCGGTEDLVSRAPESAVDVGSVANADEETTTTTSIGTTNANCTYPTIPFSRGAAVREWERDGAFEQDFSGMIITSKAQLDALNLSEEHNVEEYTDNYFTDKALVVLEFRLTSGSIQLRVDTVGVSGNTMTVFYTTVRPTPFTNDMAYRRILLEVDRKQVERVKTVVGYEDQICSHFSNPTVF